MFFIGVLGWPPKNKTGRNVVKANIVFTILDQTLTLSVSSAVAIHSGTLSLLIVCLDGDVVSNQARQIGGLNENYPRNQAMHT